MSKAKIILAPTPSNIHAKIHPVVLFSICDAYIRRNDKQERVIGTLLGVVIEGVIDVRSCYVVPHNESSDQVAIDIAHHKTMLDLHQRVSPQEGIVGWFSTGATISNSDALIQDYYSKEAKSGKENIQPIHLVLDTSLASKRFNLRVYVSRNLTLGERALATEFVEVPTEVLMADVERVGVDLLRGGTLKAGGEEEGLLASIVRLQKLLDKAHDYVSAVVAGKKPADLTVGRYLADTLAVVPHFGADAFEALFSDNVQDTMLLTYLSTLVRSHVALAEKLGTAQLPLM